MRKTIFIASAAALLAAIFVSGCAKPLRQPVVTQEIGVQEAAPASEGGSLSAPVPAADDTPAAPTMPQGPKQSIAIYMVGEEPAAVKGAHKVIGSELAKALTKSSAYAAVDRSQQAIEMMAVEHIYQRSGAVNDEQIKKLGVQIGAQFLCMAEISVVMGSYFLEARVVDVETAEVSRVASVDGNLRNAGDVVRVAQAVALELVPEQGSAQAQTPQKKRGVNYTFRQIEANPDKAISDYREALRQEPETAEYYLKRGFAYMHKEDYDLAIADFNYAIRLAPDAALYYFFRGAAYGEKGRRHRDNAISDYGEALRLNPDYAEAYYKRGRTYYDKDDCDNAVADYNMALRLNPDYAEAYNGRGAAYSCKKNYDGAIADFNRALRLNPNLVDAYSNRLRAYLGKNDFSDFRSVIAGYGDTLRRNPNHAEAYLNRGLAYYYAPEKSGSFVDSAFADFNEAIRLNRDLAAAYYTRGNVYFDKKDFNSAIADYSDAIRVNPEYARAYHSRGYTYILLRDFDRAKEDYKAAIRYNPADNRARNRLEDLENGKWR